ncbi:helix-turn-helix domain-containing protein [Pseudomarimonas arenosa]|uniref:AraC family transcriptional regulator n=1 Tax=Pseudomarimonas arenosa TaxID=2774145 RepID=A0AAW3ZIB7_9GAMM|nr:helix-turn-helix domain-containing protein [Pseudomarimonas arenosa]MBD8525828.1 AraC family transcriptional regulator [Pseudomarimonas arenosa]
MAAPPAEQSPGPARLAQIGLAAETAGGFALLISAQEIRSRQHGAAAVFGHTYAMPVFTTIELLQALVMLPSLLLSVLLFWQRRLWPLAAFLGLLGLQLGWNLALSHGFPGPAEIAAGLDFSYGPLILALARHLGWRERPGLGIWHALPVVLMPLALLAWPELSSSVWWLAGCSASVYLLLALRELDRYHRALRATHSAFEAQSLVWLRRAICGLLLVFLLDVLRVALRPHWPGSEPGLIIAIYLGALCFVGALVWRGLQQPALFAGISLDEPALAAAPTRQECAEDQNTVLASLAERIQRHLHEARPHLDAELTVQTLAAQLGAPAKQVSAAINQHLGRNFNDLINAARVEAACALLRDPARSGDKLLAIQLDAGFGSRTVFNAAFKRETGLTPSQWRRQNRP